MQFAICLQILLSSLLVASQVFLFSSGDSGIEQSPTPVLDDKNGGSMSGSPEDESIIPDKNYGVDDCVNVVSLDISPFLTQVDSEYAESVHRDVIRGFNAKPAQVAHFVHLAAWI